VGELYSLIRFLRIYPYAFYFCRSGRSKHAAGKPCDCASLDHPFKRERRSCDHCKCGRPACPGPPGAAAASTQDCKEQCKRAAVAEEDIPLKTPSLPTRQPCSWQQAMCRACMQDVTTPARH